MPRIRASLGSLGDDTLGAGTTMTESEWRTQMLAKQDEIIDQHKRWADGDRFQKYLAIGATLAIPVSAAIWRVIGRALSGRRRRR